MNRREKIILSVSALLFSIFMLTGLINEYPGFFLSSSLKYVKLGLTFVALFVSFLILFTVLIRLLERMDHDYKEVHSSIYVSIIAAVSIFHLIIFYPGTTFNDGMRQLHSFFGDIEWANHDPVFSTAVIGFIVKAGRNLVDDNFGMFLYSLLVTILSLLVFYYLFVTLSRIGTSHILVILSVVYLAILPIIRLYTITLCKDTLFAITTLLLVTTLINMYQKHKEEKSVPVRYYIFLALECLLICNLRNDGKYIALLTLIGLFFAASKKKRPVYASFIGFVVIFSILYSHLLLPVLDIKEGSIREALSVPLQQTALYIREYPEDLDEEDIETLNSVFTCSLSKVGKRYLPDISDPVKNKFVYSPTNEQLRAYFKVWWKGLIRHPKLYVTAYIQNYYGYVYPLKTGSERGFYSFAVSEENMYNFDFHHNDGTESLRSFIPWLVDIICHIPVISLLYCPGMYVWVLLLYIMYCILKRNGPAIIPVLPLLGIFLIACLSPVNCRIRYVLSLIFCLPAILAIWENVAKKRAY